MTPRWTIGFVTDRYACVAYIWEADVWRKVRPDTTHYRWGVTLSNEPEDQCWFDDVDAFFHFAEDRWLGHFPAGFEEQLRAIVALLD